MENADRLILDLSAVAVSFALADEIEERLLVDSGKFR